MAPSFENGADVWFVHLRGKFADLNIPKISLIICRQVTFFKMVHTRILRFAIMEKQIDSVNLISLIFRTLQYSLRPPCAPSLKNLHKLHTKIDIDIHRVNFMLTSCTLRGILVDYCLTSCYFVLTSYPNFKHPSEREANTLRQKIMFVASQPYNTKPTRFNTYIYEANT